MLVNVVIRNRAKCLIFTDLLRVKTENEAVIKVMEKEVVCDGDIVEIEVVEY